MSYVAHIINFTTAPKCEETVYGLGQYDTLKEAAAEVYYTINDLINFMEDKISDFSITPILFYGGGEDNYCIVAKCNGNVYYKGVILGVPDNDIPQ